MCVYFCIAKHRAVPWELKSACYFNFHSIKEKKCVLVA
jgi:hypothetical protein